MYISIYVMIFIISFNTFIARRSVIDTTIDDAISIFIYNLSYLSETNKLFHSVDRVDWKEEEEKEEKEKGIT